MRLFLSVIFILFAGYDANAKGMCDFPVPEYRINAFAFTGISEKTYDAVNAKILATYKKTFDKLGCPLVVHDSWNDDELNAQAWYENGECHVEIFGGLARHPYMTEASTLQVGLHEVGHFLGGEPDYPGQNMSCEGQADYFSTAYGMPKAGRGSVTSSKHLVWTLADLAGESKPVKPIPHLPDVRRTYCGHPDAACRWLTYDAGRVKGERPRCWFKP